MLEMVMAVMDEVGDKNVFGSGVEIIQMVELLVWRSVQVLGGLLTEVEMVVMVVMVELLVEVVHGDNGDVYLLVNEVLDHILHEELVSLLVGMVNMLELLVEILLLVEIADSGLVQMLVLVTVLCW